MYIEDIINKINQLMKEIQTDKNTSKDTAKIALHGLLLTQEWLTKGMSYEYYIKNNEIPKLKNISHF